MTETPGRRWKTGSRLWKRIKPTARQMRHDPTEAEDHLWQAIRRRSLGPHFRRQFTFGPYIVDFFCWKHRLIVEVDGKIHLERKFADSARDEYLRNHGFEVLRFTNEEVLGDLDRILATIQTAIRDSAPPLQTGEGAGGRGGSGYPEKDAKKK